jgi:hypothetical protein
LLFWEQEKKIHDKGNEKIQKKENKKEKNKKSTPRPKLRSACVSMDCATKMIICRLS